MRAALYARFSTKMQREASIEDQTWICRRLVETNGWSEAQTYTDMGLSGASHLRPGYQRLLEDARRGRFDVVVAESIDRISRDQEHVAAFYKQMLFAGVRVVTVAEGPIDELHVGLKGTMSALFLKDLAQKTRRGLEGRVRGGKSAGGLSYGYRLDRQPLPDGTFTTGERTIDPDEALTIIGIFRAYAAGESARMIASQLNAAGTPAPRGGTWSFSTISGNWKRGTGILNNDLYVGRLVWNRQRFVKDPETGKRQARLNPPEDWVIEDVPDLRIVDQELWDRVKARQGAIRTDILAARETNTAAPGAQTARRQRYLFSGLVTCGDCGARYIMVSASRYGCSAARNRGTCENRRTILRSEIEERVLSGLRDRLMAPDLVAEFVAEFRKAVQEERREAIASRTAQETRLKAVTTEIDNIVDAIANGMFHASMKAKMDTLEAERTDIEVRLAETPEPDPVALHPRISEIYRQKVDRLAQSLTQEDTRQEAAEILRTLIDAIVVRPEQDGQALELRGELAAILALCADEGSGHADARRVAGAGQVTMVAGVGFEPTTFRL